MANNYFLRTDILPDELPLLFSNRQLYTNPNFTEDKIKESLITANEKKISFSHIGELRFNQETIPLKFNVKVRNDKNRQISLLHPIAQIQCLSFIMKYEKRILLSTAKSHYSVRAPAERNENQISIDASQLRIIQQLENSFYPHSNQDMFSEKTVKEFRHYFSFKSVNSMGKLLESSEFIYSQQKFLHVQKVDIQNFFDSIYTHSLSWALFKSKRAAKNYRKSYCFENNIDHLMQSLNFSETNGIVTGPEFCRTVAEILLSQIDLRIEKELYNKGLMLDRDYKIYRFVDDYFIFFNTEQTIADIISALNNNLTNFNLSLNQHKALIYASTSNISLSPVTQVMDSIETFKLKKEYLYTIKQAEKNIERNNIRGSQQSWKILFAQIQQLSTDYPKDSTKIINYFLTILPEITNMFPKDSISFFKTLKIYLAGIIDLLKQSPSHKTYTLFYSNIISLTNQFEEITANTIQSQKVKLKSYTFLFHTLANILSFQWFDLTQGYDLLAILKYFTKYDMYLDSYKLIELLKKSDSNYFCLTAVAYYIYDKQKKSTTKKYLTVGKVLYRIVKTEIEHFDYKGDEKKVWFDATWFYLINDFAKYPGFSNTHRYEFTKILSQNVNASKFNRAISNAVSGESYYNWNGDYDELKKSILKKKIINHLGSDFSY